MEQVNAQRQKVALRTYRYRRRKSSKLSKTRDRRPVGRQNMVARHLIEPKPRSTTCQKFLITLENSLHKIILIFRPMEEGQNNKAKQSNLSEVELEVALRGNTKQMKVSKNTKIQIQRRYLPTIQGRLEKSRREIVRDKGRTSSI